MSHAFSIETERALAFYNEHYSSLILHLDSGKKMYLRDHRDHFCRFCNKGSSTVTFNEIAHSLPELIGNKTLLSCYECDSCNDLFGRHFEDDLGKFLGIERTISQIHGKRGVPSYKSSDGGTHIDFNNSGLKIAAIEKSQQVRIDAISNRILLKASKQSYNPRNVYKCFVKMGLSVMPEYELINFAETLNWLQIEPPESDGLNSNFFICIESFAPGPMPFPWITTALFRRRIKSAPLPYMSFYVAFSNYTFQIFLPLSPMDDAIIGKKLILHPFPNWYHKASQYGDVRYRQLDLSQNNKKSGEDVEIDMHIDAMIEIKGT